MASTRSALSCEAQGELCLDMALPLLFGWGPWGAAIPLCLSPQSSLPRLPPTPAQPLEWGRDLDRSLSDFPYQARVEPLHVFEPVPEDMLEGSLPRKRHKVTQERMKFFEKSLNARQCAEVWARMAMAHGKLLRSA